MNFKTRLADDATYKTRKKSPEFGQTEQSTQLPHAVDYFTRLKTKENFKV